MRVRVSVCVPGIELFTSWHSHESGIPDTSRSKVGLVIMGLASCPCSRVSFVVNLTVSVAVSLSGPHTVVIPSCSLSVVSVGGITFCGGFFFYDLRGRGAMCSSSAFLVLGKGCCEPVYLPLSFLYLTGGGVPSRDESDEDG